MFWNSFHQSGLKKLRRVEKVILMRYGTIVATARHALEIEVINVR